MGKKPSARRKAAASAARGFATVSLPPKSAGARAGGDGGGEGDGGGGGGGDELWNAPAAAAAGEGEGGEGGGGEQLQSAPAAAPPAQADAAPAPSALRRGGGGGVADGDYVDAESRELAELADRFRDLAVRKVEQYFAVFEPDPAAAAAAGDATRAAVLPPPPALKVASKLEAEIVDLLKESDAQDERRMAAGEIPDLRKKPRSLRELDTNYRILAEMEFSAADVRNSMVATGGADLDSALEWLCLNLPFERLPVGFADKPHHVAESQGEPVKAREGFTASKKSLPVTLAAEAPLVTQGEPAAEKSAGLTDNARNLAKLQARHEASRHLALELADPLYDPNPEHARLKAMMVHLNKMNKRKNGTAECHRQRAPDRAEQEIKSELALLEGHMNFNRRDAQRLFSEACQAMELAYDADDRNGISADSTLSEEPNNEDPGPAPEPSAAGEEGEEGLEFDIFEHLPLPQQPPPPSTEAGDIAYREFDHKTKWSGMSPAELLAEFVRSQEKGSVANFTKTEMTPTRAFRAVANVRRKSGKVETFEPPTGEWCHTWEDAKAVASVWALQSMTNSPMYIRLAPPFRDLWMEWKNQKMESTRRATLEEDVARYRFLKTLLPEGADLAAPEVEETEVKEVQAEPTIRARPPRVIDMDRPSEKGEIRRRKFTSRANDEEYQRLAAQRSSLPASKFKQQIIDRVRADRGLIVSGDTGCGKSTQIPQFICEDALVRGVGDRCSVVCTQPRRISAMSIARRVSAEMGDPKSGPGTPGALVGYQIRLETKISKSTILTFCTTGILIRRIETDPYLEGVTHVVVDEVHERSMETDLLLILLRQVRSRRPDIALVLMSATMNAQRIARYFGAPIVEIPGRTFPVATAFLEQVVEMTGFLLEEDSQYSKRMAQSSGRVEVSNRGGSRAVNLEWDSRDVYGEDSVVGSSTTAALEDLAGLSDRAKRTLDRVDEERVNYDLILSLLGLIVDGKNLPPAVPTDGAVLVFLPGMQDIRILFDMVAGTRSLEERCVVFPLHSSLASASHAAVFDPPPAGKRKIVLATNIAETGVTIPDVTVVIDTAKARQIRHDDRRKITSLQDVFVSRASCTQRRGRAGRVQPGFCFCLVTRNRFATMLEEHETPEILRLPLADVCLRLLVCGFKDPSHVLLNESLDPPSATALEAAFDELHEVQAVDPATGELTSLGRHLSRLPVDLRLGKLLIYAAMLGCVDPMLTIAASLATRPPFLRPFGKEAEADWARLSFNRTNSDLTAYANAHEEWRKAMRRSKRAARQLCAEKFLSHDGCAQIEGMRAQFLAQLVEAGFVSAPGDEARISRLRDAGHAAPTDVAAAGAALLPAGHPADAHASSPGVVNAAVVAGLHPRVVRHDPATGKLHAGKGRPPGFADVHPSSVNALAHKGRKPQFDWLAYDVMLRTRKTWVRDTTFVGSAAVALFGGPLKIKYRAKRLLQGDWIQFRCHPRTAVVIKRLHREVDNAFCRCIDDPTSLFTAGERTMIEAMVKLLEREESSGPCAV